MIKNYNEEKVTNIDILLGECQYLQQNYFVLIAKKELGIKEALFSLFFAVLMGFLLKNGMISIVCFLTMFVIKLAFVLFLNKNHKMLFKCIVKYLLLLKEKNKNNIFINQEDKTTYNFVLSKIGEIKKELN